MLFRKEGEVGKNICFRHVSDNRAVTILTMTTSKANRNLLRVFDKIEKHNINIIKLFIGRMVNVNATGPDIHSSTDSILMQGTPRSITCYAKYI